MMLGKLAAKKDSRNFCFASLAKRLAIPAAYDTDARLPPMPLRMFRNDALGDCVIAARANHTLRFEAVEQRKVLAITDAEVAREYFQETGGPDVGLVYLDSLNRWRQKGWKAAARNYKIAAFAEITGADRREQTRQAIYADLGVQLGIQVPQSALDQFEAGKVWDVVKSKAGNVIQGGHAVYVVAYDGAGLTCLTWAKRQRMTWRFFERFADEVYAVIDAKNTAKQRRLLDLKLLSTWIHALAV